MLKKLMKYEFKSTGRAFLPVYGAQLASALMTRLMMWGDNISALNNAFLYNLISGLVVVLFVAMLVATFVVTLMVVLQRFSKNLLGEEGYLSMTLPVKPYQHILSKSIVAVFWYFASWIAAVLSFMVLMWNRHIFRDILRAVTFLFTEIQWDWQSVLLIAELFLLAVVSIFCAVQLMYASLSLGQLSRRSRKLASFGYFLVLSLVSEFIIGVVSQIFSIFLPAHFLNHFSGVQILVWFLISLTVLFSAAYFFISNYMLSRKLNLE